MPVTAYLERARTCADMADRAANDADRKKLLEIAEAWADLAKAEAARIQSQPESNKSALS